MTEPADSPENRVSAVERELSHLRDAVSRHHADVAAITLLLERLADDSR